MTVSTTINRASYNGNSVTTAFAAPFYFFANTDLIVTETIGAGAPTLLTLGTDYTVTGAGTGAGTVTRTVATATGTVILIVRAVASTQGSSFPNNTAFDGPTVEAAFDRAVILAQQNADALSLAVINAAGVGTAATIQNVPAGGIASVNVQTALNELDTKKAPLASPVLTGTPSLPTGTTGVTQAAGDSSTKIATTAFVGAAIPYYIAGLQIVNNGTTSMDVQVGACTDGNNTHTLLNVATFTKTQAAFAAGSGNGGKMSAAAMANNTWYYFYAMRKDADGTIEFGFDVSPTAPTAQAGYTAANYRYIGARKTLLAASTWDTFIQHGDQVTWGTPPALDSNVAMTTANRTLVTTNVPALKVEWLGAAEAVFGAGAGGGFILTDPATADVAPSSSVATPLGDLIWNNTSTTGGTNVVGQLRCWTNVSGQIGIRGTSTATAQVQTRGWTDPRGKPV